MKKKILIMLLSTALIASLLTGCQSKSAASTDSDSKSTVAEQKGSMEAAEQPALAPYTPVDPNSVAVNAESDFVYEINETSKFAQITQYVGTATQVRIPDTLGGYSDIRIAKEAFRKNETITYLYIPENVRYSEAFFLACTALQEVYLSGTTKTISQGAFKECTALRRVEMGEGLEILEGGLSTGVFYGCTSLTDVLFPTTLQMIGDCTFDTCENLEKVDLSQTQVFRLGQMAFANCSKLTEISLPATLSGSDNNGMSSSAFLSCPSLTNVIIDPANSELTLENGILYYGDELICGIEGIEGNDIVIREGTTEIRYSAFEYQENLHSVTLPDSMTDIGRNAFNNCTGLETVNFGNELETIQQNAFYECEALKEVILPDTVTELGDSAFAFCTSLEKAVLPDNMTMSGSIEEYVFSICTKAVFTFQGKDYTYEKAADLTNAISQN